MNYWIWYATLKTLNRIQKKKLLELFQNPNNIFKLKKEELLNLKFLKQSNIEEMLQNRDLSLIKKFSIIFMDRKRDVLMVKDVS